MAISLRMRYHRPVPLETPLRASARVPGTDGLHCPEETPSTLLVETDGIFVVPDPDLTRALFPSLNQSHKVRHRPYVETARSSLHA
jgi:hypothetical protein